MIPPRTISVVGFKDSGKTQVVEAIVKEFTARGLRVGTLKHTAENMDFDTPGKDTNRHREAGAKATAILHNSAAALFINDHLALQEAARRLGNLDFLVIEGFKTVNTHARVLVPREDEDLERLSNGLEIAAIRTPSSNFKGGSQLPVFDLSESPKLVERILEKAYPILPGTDCHGCGYDGCLSLGQAVLKGEAEARQCVRNSTSFVLRVNDESVPLNNFVRRILTQMTLGFVGTLKGGEAANKVELAFEVSEDE